MQSNWPINHALYDAVQDSIPDIARYRASEGREDLGKTPIHKMCKKVFPEIYTVPLFRRQWCKMMVEEIKLMEQHVAFKPNDDEDELRQIPEIVLRDHCPELYSRMWFVAWHHDESADISVVIPLNTGGYVGGGTEFHNHGTLKPLPSGHALIFPSFTNLHRGLAVESGDRYLLVFWLHNKLRNQHLYEEVE